MALDRGRGGFDARWRWLLDCLDTGDFLARLKGIMSTAEALQETPALLFTDAAARKVSDLIRGEGNPNLMLRVFVQGGGCSGLQYGFEFDEVIQEGDTCVENLGVKLLVDPMSVQYLTGAEIDYREGLEGAQFVIRNPNATTTCGCGSSFSAA
jgi:iron-sulfur cluster insertion protein